MKILIACEFSGIVRDAFISRGHNTVSCDLLPTEKRGPHYHGDVRNILCENWDMIIAFPPCTHLAGSGARWWKEKQADGRQQEAIDFFMLFVNHPCPKICIENPKGIMSQRYRKPDQIIQPWQFGHEVQKATCLWLKGLLPLKPTKIVDRGMIYVDPRGEKHGGEFVMRAKNSYSPLMMLAPGQERWKIRSRTFPGVAAAMAQQWSQNEIYS